MKRFATLLTAVAVTTLGLSGCAGLITASSGETEIDQAKVAAVQRAATRYGYQVVWVNPPLKKVVTPGS